MRRIEGPASQKVGCRSHEERLRRLATGAGCSLRKTLLYRLEVYTGLVHRRARGSLLRVRGVARATCDFPTRRTHLWMTNPHHQRCRHHYFTRSIITLGLDVHKEAITVAVLPTESPAPTRLDRLANDLAKLQRCGGTSARIVMFLRLLSEVVRTGQRGASRCVTMSRNLATSGNTSSSPPMFVRIATAKSRAG